MDLSNVDLVGSFYVAIVTLLGFAMEIIILAAGLLLCKALIKYLRDPPNSKK